MTCVHLRQLYELCQEQKLRLSSSDLIHIVCEQCDRDEVCPSQLMEDFEAEHPESADAPPTGGEQA